MSETTHTPEGLLERIMRRLGLEKQLLIIRRHFGTNGVFLLCALVVGVLVIVGIKDMLAHSGFGPYLSLVRSDFGFIVSHRTMYLSALLGSAPIALFAALLVVLTIFLVCVRLTVVYGERLLTVLKSIKKTQRYEYHISR